MPLTLAWKHRVREKQGILQGGESSPVLCLGGIHGIQGGSTGWISCSAQGLGVLLCPAWVRQLCAWSDSSRHSNSPVVGVPTSAQDIKSIRFSLSSCSWIMLSWPVLARAELALQAATVMGLGTWLSGAPDSAELVVGLSQRSFPTLVLP